VTGAVDRVKPWTNADPTFAAMDVAGYNYLYEQYEADHDRVPSRIILATESAPPAAFDAWMGVLDHPYVIGDFVWTGMDYLGESGIGHTRVEGEPRSFLLPYPWHISNCGDIDICGWKRPQSYYRDVLWHRGEPLFIVVHRPPSARKRNEPIVPVRTSAESVGQPSTNPPPRELVSNWGWPDVEPSWLWPGREGEPLEVDVYSALDRVELFLNGTAIGARPTSRATKFTASFTVPYAPGVLRAVGYAGDRQSATAELETPGPPAALRLTPDRTTIRPVRNDLSFVTVEVVDANGRPVSAAPRITFAVSGPAEIAAVANSNPADASSYRGTVREAWRGRALAIIRPTGRGAGTVTLTAAADGLTSGSTSLTLDGSTRGPQ
jgi:beta-galactosidase